MAAVEPEPHLQYSSAFRGEELRKSWSIGACWDLYKYKLGGPISCLMNEPDLLWSRPLLELEIDLVNRRAGGSEERKERIGSFSFSKFSSSCYNRPTANLLNRLSPKGILFYIRIAREPASWRNLSLDLHLDWFRSSRGIKRWSFNRQIFHLFLEKLREMFLNELIPDE